MRCRWWMVWLPVAAASLAGCAGTLPAVRAPSPDGPARANTRDPQLVRAGLVEAASAIPDALSGPQPVEAYLRHALEHNPAVRAASFNLQAMRERLPQAVALDDPVLSNSIFPIPSVAPQFSLMGYMPYDFLLAQQFPWFGTLRLRGEAAAQDAQVALFELAATQLDVVANVKRAYFDLHFNERALLLLEQNRALAEDFLQVARERFRTGTAGQADVLRAEVAVSDIDREIESTRGARTEAQAELARLLHLSPEADLQTLPELPSEAIPGQIETLYHLALAARPDLQGRLAAIARDERAIALAQKRYCPNVTLGLIYQNMERRNAEAAETASGMPNVGLFVGLNMPIYRGKLDAGVREARARAAADAALLEVERDQARRDVKDLFVQASVQRNVLGLLRRINLPAAQQVLEAIASDYRAGNPGVDYLNVISAWRDRLQVELQIAQLEAELGKTLAALERAVGGQLNDHPPDPATLAAPPPGAASPLRLPEPARIGSQGSAPGD